MKTILLAVMFLWSMISMTGAASVCGSYAHAAEITFQWDKNTEGDLAGYRLYQSTVSGQYTYGANYAVATIDKALDTVMIAVPDGKYFWVLTAVDNAGNESGPSNEVALTVDFTAPANPKNLRRSANVVK